MSYDKYSSTTAKTIAQRIYVKWGQYIKDAAQQFNVPEHYLAGLTGMENPNCYEYPDRKSYRFESGVFAKLKKLQSFASVAFGYNGVRKADVAGLSEEALRNLATSYGPTQIMGYYVLTIFKKFGATVADLRNSRIHYAYTCRFLNEDPVLATYLKARNFAQVCHIWNSGRVWNGRNDGIHTYSPYYMYNCGLVASAYAELVQQRPAENKKIDSPESKTLTTPFATDVPPSALAPKIERTFIGLEENKEMMNDENAAPTGENNYTEMSEPLTSPDTMPKISAKPGYQTSQGILTMLFTTVAMILSALGYTDTAAQVNDFYDKLAHLGQIILPILVAVPVLIAYINSRGKIQSNQIWATTALNNAVDVGARIGIPGMAKVESLIEGIEPLFDRQGRQLGYSTAELGTSRTLDEHLARMESLPTKSYRADDLATLKPFEGLTKDDLRPLTEKLDRIIALASDDEEAVDLDGTVKPEGR